MADFHEGCIVCGASLIYFEEARPLLCGLCGKQSLSNTLCKEGHYICDECHAKEGIAAITGYARGAQASDPIAMAGELMQDPRINMHGPEHHYMVTALLLAAYKNAGGDIDLEKCLGIARERTAGLPGGICGMWGSCGAGICTGIYASIVLGTSPLSGRQWGMANELTSLALRDIAAYGGPRCCKRDVYLALRAAAAYTSEKLGAIMQTPQSITCGFYSRNSECRKKSCPFYGQE